MNSNNYFGSIFPIFIAYKIFWWHWDQWLDNIRLNKISIMSVQNWIKSNMNRMFFYCVANVVKRDLVSPGSLLYNSNYAMDAYVQRHRRKCHSMRLRRTMSYASLTHVEITSVTHVETRQWRTSRLRHWRYVYGAENLPHVFEPFFNFEAA